MTENTPQADELGLYDLGESFLAEYESAVKDGYLPNFVCADSPVEVLWHLLDEIDELRKALAPFAAVAESDIGQDETDVDIFQPMRSGYNRAPLITVGDMRGALAVMSAQPGLARSLRKTTGPQENRNGSRT
jgi:hypothetical protein